MPENGICSSSALYNPTMQSAESPEFDPKRPVASAAAVLRGIFFAPRAFYLGFRAEGSLREPILFVVLVSAVAGLMSAAVNFVYAAVSGTLGVDLLGVMAVNLAFAVLGPLVVGLFSGAYLLSIRAFLGPEGNYKQVYRILAYAWGAAVLFWIPGLNAFAFTYVTLVLMLLGIRYVYRTSFLTALVTALVGYVPSSILFVLLIRLGVFATGLEPAAP